MCLLRGTDWVFNSDSYSFILIRLIFMSRGYLNFCTASNLANHNHTLTVSNMVINNHLLTIDTVLIVTVIYFVNVSNRVFTINNSESVTFKFLQP